MSDADSTTRRDAGERETARANRTWWDAEAPSYAAEHGSFLGDSDFVWGPEGVSEEELGLLGDVADRRVLEVGAGAAQCSRWLRARGARVVATDLSSGMLRHSCDLDARTGAHVPLTQCDAVALPFADASFDLACSAYGAVPFVASPDQVMREVARVLRPGGLWVFSTSHPIRWTMLDVPGEDGLVCHYSYFDRTPYVEQDDSGHATYVEHHRTLGDRVRDIVAAGLVLEDLVEPEWPLWNDETWGGWSPTRGAVVPGTAIFVCRKP